MPLCAATCVALVLASGAARADDIHARLSPADFSRFDLDMDAGNVRIRAAEPLAEARIDATPVRWSDSCSFHSGRDAERGWARIEGTTDGVHACSADLTITIVPSTTVVVRLGAGDVRIERLEGDLTADLGAGDLVLHGMTGALDVEMGSGHLEGTFSGPRLRAEIGAGGVYLTELQAPAVVELGMGNADLVYRQAPAGTVALRTGTGSLQVLLPQGTVVQTQLTVGIGSTSVQLPTGPGADTLVDADTGVGRIRVAPTETTLEAPSED